VTALEVRTQLAHSDADRIEVRGHDLNALVGHVSLTDMLFLEVQGRLPDPSERRLADAALVTLVEHGFTPSAIAARMTHLGSPDFLQGAVAAGLLGLGSTFVGSIEGAARMLQEAVAAAGPDTSPAAIADTVVAAYRRDGRPIPGLGHHLHKRADPRVGRLIEVAEEEGRAGPHLRVLRELEAAFERQSGKLLPVNATGAIGAVASDLGFDWRVCRAFGIVARCVGLVGHVWEEMRQPAARAIWHEVERAAGPPAPDRRQSEDGRR
jgi:citrate synthase